MIGVEHSGWAAIEIFQPIDKHIDWNSLETEFLTGDKWQSKTLFLVILSTFMGSGFSIAAYIMCVEWGVILKIIVNVQKFKTVV